MSLAFCTVDRGGRQTPNRAAAGWANAQIT